MKILRTPDERFENLAGYDFAPHYLVIEDGEGGGALRVHYVDEGPRGAAPVLLLHGEPSWSYLYRRMIPILVRAGHRVIAPDLIGFGRSDKPAEKSDYTYQRHVDWMRAFLEELALGNISLFCQDWGGLIGLRLAAEQGSGFARIIASNTGLPTGDQKTPEAFARWLRYSREAREFPIGAIIQGGCVRKLPDEVMRAYNAPFPDERYKAGARIFPSLVPVTPDDPAASANRAAWKTLGSWTKPFLTAFSDSDPITRGMDAVFQRHVPGAEGQPHTTIKNAGHFVQEDRGEVLAGVVVDFLHASGGAAAHDEGEDASGHA